MLHQLVVTLQCFIPCLAKIAFSFPSVNQPARLSPKSLLSAWPCIMLRAVDTCASCCILHRMELLLSVFPAPKNKKHHVCYPKTGMKIETFPPHLVQGVNGLEVTFTSARVVHVSFDAHVFLSFFLCCKPRKPQDEFFFSWTIHTYMCAHTEHVHTCDLCSHAHISCYSLNTIRHYDTSLMFWFCPCTHIQDMN